MVLVEGNQSGAARQWALVFLCLPALALADTRVIDRSVALIDGWVLTQSELEFETRVLLIQGGGVEAAFAPLDLATLKKALESVISQQLEMAEADKLKAYPLEEGELDRALATFEARLGGRAELDRFLAQSEVDDAVLSAVLGRILRTQRVLDGKLRLKAQVSEAEAKRQQAERPEFKGLPIAVVRQKLIGERFNSLVAAELLQVRKGATVRLLGPFADRLGADGGGP